MENKKPENNITVKVGSYKNKLAAEDVNNKDAQNSNTDTNKQVKTNSKAASNNVGAKKQNTKVKTDNKTSASKSTKSESEKLTTKKASANIKIDADKNIKTETDKSASSNITDANKGVESASNKVLLKPKFKPTQDAIQNKNIAWLAYILFFIPLLINRKSPFIRHHANEGLEINIFDTIGITLLLIGTLINKPSIALHGVLIICVLIGSGLLVLTTITKIYMVTTTLKGKTTNAPWTWKLRIIK